MTFARRAARAALPLAVTLVLSAQAACTSSDAGSPDAAVKAADAGPDLPPSAPFGSLCPSSQQGQFCKGTHFSKKLDCVIPENSVSGDGFCSPTCNDSTHKECYGVSNGLWAQCLLSQDPVVDGGVKIYHCAFLCRTKTASWSCPPDMICPKANSEGQAICLPCRPGTKGCRPKK